MAEETKDTGTETAAPELNKENLDKALTGLADLMKGESCTGGKKETKKGKKEKEEEEEDEDEFKSFADDLPGDVEDAVEVSSYLKGMTDLVVDSLDTMHKSLTESMDNQGEFNKSFAQGLIGIGEFVKAQGEMIKSLSERLEVVEKAPAHTPKTQTVPGGRFVKSGTEEEAAPLSKGEAAGRLADMLEKGENGITQDDVLKMDAGVLTANAAKALGIEYKKTA